MGAWVYKRTTGLPLPPTRAPPRSPIASLHIVHTTVCPLSLSLSLVPGRSAAHQPKAATASPAKYETSPSASLVHS
jgi:hypothetical protein